MIGTVSKDTKEVLLDKFNKFDINELYFEDKNNWYIEYDKIALSYEQPRGNSYFDNLYKDMSCSVLNTDRVKLDLTDDGEANIGIIKSFRSINPSYRKEGINYTRLVKQEM